MTSENLKFWTTLIANLGVLLGLLFLVLEIRQNSEIAATQNRMEYAAVWRTIDSARQDESFAELVAKSYDSPESLSATEVIRLDSYYWGVLDQMMNAQVASRSDLRDGAFEHVADQAAKTYFANEFGQVWWRQVRLLFADVEGARFRDVMDDAIEKVKQSEYSNPYHVIVDELAAQSATLDE